MPSIFNLTNWFGTDRVSHLEAAVFENSQNLVSAFGQVTLTYGTTVATNFSLGGYFTLNITDGVAFAFSAPTNPVAGGLLTYDIKNGSGGAHGTITWNSAFLGGAAGAVGTGAFVTIANTKRRIIQFRYDGTNWIEVSRTADQ